MDNKGILSGIAFLVIFVIMFIVTMLFILPSIGKFISLIGIPTSFSVWDFIFNPKKVFMVFALGVFIAAVITGIVYLITRKPKKQTIIRGRG